MKIVIAATMATTVSAGKVFNWKAANGKTQPCPKGGTYKHTWKLERHTSSKHGDICRGQGGHWQTPTGCERKTKGFACKSYSCMPGKVDEPCRLPGAPKPTVCPATGKHGHMWTFEAGVKGHTGDICRGQNGHWFPPVNCKRTTTGKPYSIFAKDTPQGKKGEMCRVPTNIYEANVALDLHVCEHQTFKAQCPSGSKIKITKASYGRLLDQSKAKNQKNWNHKKNQLCPHKHIQKKHVGKCHAKESKSLVAKKCDGQSSCQIKAKNGFFGDPCKGTFKYLTVTYECEKDAAAVSLVAKYIKADGQDCDAKFCKNWECDTWCACYEPKNEQIYAAAGCNDDSEPCECKK